MKNFIIRILSLFYSDELHLHYKIHPNGDEEYLYANKNEYIGNEPGRYSITEREEFIRRKI